MTKFWFCDSVLNLLPMFAVGFGVSSDRTDMLDAVQAHNDDKP